jgi:hypothetical protein
LVGDGGYSRVAPVAFWGHLLLLNISGISNISNIYRISFISCVSNISNIPLCFGKSNSFFEKSYFAGDEFGEGGEAVGGAGGDGVVGSVVSPG